MAEPEARGFDKEELEKALSGSSADELREMARRLSKSLEGMQEVLKDLENERTCLKDDAEYLNSTITLMMQEMQKLNIGSTNTVDPKLAEGPLDFVGRFWEKVKPRDTAYQTSEHVGEIKKPVAGENPTPNVQQVAREVGQHVVQKAQKIPGKLGPLFQRAQGFISDKQKELVEVVAATAKARAQPQAESGGKSERRQKREARGEAAGGYPAGASGDAPASSPPTAPAEAPAAEAPEEAAAPAASATAAAEEAASPAAEAPAEKPASAGSPSKSSENEAAAAAGGSSDKAGEEIASTVLIVATLTIDDGSVVTLQVCASDRTREAARRFVQENSLKAWFLDPLTAWLKKVEEDADSFPVHLEANLMEIRSQFSKTK